MVVWHAAGDVAADSIGNESEVPHAYDRLAIAVVEIALARGAPSDASIKRGSPDSIRTLQSFEFLSFGTEFDFTLWPVFLHSGPRLVDKMKKPLDCRGKERPEVVGMLLLEAKQGLWGTTRHRDASAPTRIVVGATGEACPGREGPLSAGESVRGRGPIQAGSCPGAYEPSGGSIGRALDVVAEAYGY